MMSTDRTSCIVKVWGSFVQKLLGISRWQQSIKPSMGPGTPRKLVLSIDRLNVARVLIECGPDHEILARALGPLGTSQMKQLRPCPPQRHLPADAPPPAAGRLIHWWPRGGDCTLCSVPQHLAKDSAYSVHNSQCKHMGGRG